MNDLTGLIAVVSIFIVMPVLFLMHYVTKWKTAPRLTRDDDLMLEELYKVARRLDERMDTVERLVAAEHPEFKPSPLRPNQESDNVPLDELARLRADLERTRR
ncbi:MAG: envelope stress response membrane protein PspB [Novosphingobium sp.]